MSLLLFMQTHYLLISFYFFLSISYNVSLLEEWLRSRGVQAGGAVATLEPLIQAVQLLQAGKKTEADARALVQTCTALSSQQVGLCLSTSHFKERKLTVGWLLATDLFYRLWRFWPSTPPTVTLMKESHWISSVRSRYWLQIEGLLMRSSI